MAAAAPSNDQIRVERRGDLLELRWADAEERLQGTLYPALPRAGEPVTLSLHVGNFQGAEFDGPITLTFQQPGAPAQVTRTLTRQGVNWHTELTPDETGLWELEVRYRNTHLKVLTAQFTVTDPPLPRGLGWGLISVAAVTALVLGMREVLHRIRASTARPEGASGSAASPPPVSTAPPAAPAASAVVTVPPTSEPRAEPVAAPESSSGSPTPPTDPSSTQ
ncbi:hypothetical protein [Pyxidicoccus caerfyrddinensis]|uniref:hypothetical protein n=1 Tax=Pyxidicoccus caerfyrddinensis TaxID=2709663 RepID=UPI001F07DC68|nr:hypothetical protein [Pyxidicoccus caerfyrddinensis]